MDDNSGRRPLAGPGVDSDPIIGAIHYRSQDVVPGGLFVAISGHRADGHDYIDDAISRGAAAIVAEKEIDCTRPLVQVTDSRRALAELAAAFYNNPSHRLNLVGITGTNGKTTVTYLVEGMLASAGYRVGVIGTVNYRYGGRQFDNPVTTPESLDLQRILAKMEAAGVTHVVMEVSSHAVDLSRVVSCCFTVGAFTNLTQDHLDYHKTMVAYWDCKRRFFTENILTGPTGGRTVVVVNSDDEHGKSLLADLASTHAQVVPFGQADGAVRPMAVTTDALGIRGQVSIPTGVVDISSQLVGMHNLENLLCAVGIGVALSLPPRNIVAGIKSVTHVPGRLERISDPDGRLIFVDYAHTPDALKNVLTTLLGITTRRIVCIFGCGGDRDTGKRAPMGEISGRLANLSIVTSDNPRGESPEKIIDQIIDGIRPLGIDRLSAHDVGDWNSESAYLVMPDREEAIQIGIQVAGPGDVVLIAGKGHETYQLIGAQRLRFDDRVAAREVLVDLSFEKENRAAP
ncbi:MAG: UDP-N-acetylmuramoyl-L-alanyl-D-glutamate--2,6-diaminopimelate ligase [Deltaproteobacteria bacterium]|nr:UDP-N-acetylmuramoyl-L-alanyl-D-glutamate--2,6-diaminopimelate ligase [Deltaproteobacteria bacterium]